MTAKRLKRSVFTIVAILFFILIGFAIAEIILRIFYKNSLALNSDERNTLFQYDQLLGWKPKPLISEDYNGSVSFHVTQNSRGFRDTEHGVKEKPRILVLGDSFVWGYDVENDEIFTAKMRKMMPEFEIVNMGVSGYGTDQELILLSSVFDEYKPDLVIIVFTLLNDPYDNSSNCRYGGYFKPYFEIKDGKLELSGVPVPHSYLYFAAYNPILSKSYLCRAIAKIYYRLYGEKQIILSRNPTFELLLTVKNLTEAKGAKFAILFQEINEYMSTFCVKNNITFADASNNFIFPSNGRHWTAEGHNYVAKIASQISKKMLTQD